MCEYRVIKRLPTLDIGVSCSHNESLRRIVLSDISGHECDIDYYANFVKINKELLGEMLADMSRQRAMKRVRYHHSSIADIVTLIEDDQAILAEYDRIIAELLAEGYIMHN